MNVRKDSSKGLQDIARQASRPEKDHTVPFVLVQVLLGLPLALYALLHWHSENLLRLCCYLAIASLASIFKVRLPGVHATMSANFLFILVGIQELSYPETLLIGCAGGLLQSLWWPKKMPRPIQVLFNFANLAVSITAGFLVFHSHFASRIGFGLPLLLAAASITYFAINTGSVAGVIALSEKRDPLKVWKECYLWSLPYYLLGALIAGGISTVNRLLSWQISVIAFPIVYWIYRSYQTYLARLEAETNHAKEIADLHLRTIEVLSLAIEAKDHTTYDHLRRVQVYAVEIGKELGLRDEELKAIRAAAMLHDIGKLAVPEHILLKPGRLTPEEFEKVKTHVAVGAQILERVQFPYPVVPIVRSHHERWDGKGYPNSLEGEKIPIGARILSVVDCFDALASDRPYRKALSIDDAMEHVKNEAGRAYDPQVVECLVRRYRELEALVANADTNSTKLQIPTNVGSGVAPSAGYAEESERPSGGSAQFLASIAGARQEAQLLFEVSKLLGNSLSLRETLSVVAVRLKVMIPHDTIVVHVAEGRNLVPEYVHGTGFDHFVSTRIPFGEGLSGWVAQNLKPIVNGNLTMETTELGVSHGANQLHSALCVPLLGKEGIAGVLTLYHCQKHAFTNDHLRMLLATSSKLGLSVENAVRFERAESSASTDFLTGLANARTLLSTLEKELARCRRNGTTLGVLVCDLNGFKQVNDTHGHLVGNKLLQEVANNLAQVCRQGDTVGRLGGDEFVCILPDFSPDGISELEPRLHSAVLDAATKTCSASAVSISGGFAFYPDDGPDADRLIAEADRRMYEAKERHHSELSKVPA